MNSFQSYLLYSVTTIFNINNSPVSVYESYFEILNVLKLIFRLPINNVCFANLDNFYLWFSPSQKVLFTLKMMKVLI